MSLKSTLNGIIKDRKGEVFTYNELKAYCEKAKYKLSNAERRLRPSESPNIERLMKNNAIIGYRYLEPGPEVKDWFRPPKTPESKPEECCYSKKAFNIHSQDCPVFEAMSHTADMLVQNHQQELLGIGKK